MDWLLLSLIAPLFWAISNFIDKYSIEYYTKGIYDFLFFSSLTTLIFLPFIVLYFGIPSLGIYSLYATLLGVLLTYSYGFYGKAIEVGETSRLVILFKLIPVGTLILGFLFLGQTITVIEFAAFMLILAGAVGLSIEHGKSGFVLTKGASWMFIAIGMWSVMFVAADYVLSYMPFNEFIVYDTLGGGIAGLTLLLISGARIQIMDGLRSATSKKCAWFTFNNIIDTAGQMAMKKALSLAPSAGMVAVVTQVQSLYVITLGLILTIFLPQYFTEDISRYGLGKKIIGAVVMFVGIAVLYLL